MKNLAIVLVSLCIFAQATSVFQTPAFLEIKANQFGKSLASLIEINMSTSDPSGRLNAISEVLDTVSVSLQNRSQHNEDEISRERGYCADAQSQLQSQIDSSEHDLQQYEEEQTNLSTEQQNTQNNSENERNDLKQNQNNHENTLKELSEENQRYEQAAKDYSEAIEACQQAVQLLSSLKLNPSGFIQSKARFGNVVALLEKHLAAHKTSSLVQPVLNVLSELASSAQEVDQEKLSKVVSLIQQLLSELRNQQADNEQRHTSSVNNLTDSLSNLENLINHSKDLISSYENRLTQIQERQQQLETLVASVKGLLELLKEQLKNTQDTCDRYDSEYAEAKNEIDQQIATLEKLKEYFHNQVVPSVENVRNSSYEDNLSV